MKIKKNSSKKILILSSIVILIVVALCLGLYFVNRSKNQNTNGGYYNPKTSNPTTNVPVTTNKEGQSEGSINSAQPGNNDTSSPSIDPSTIPSSPIGTFVSNHSPNLSGSPAPNAETSTCTTTPGAKCEIIFTQGSLIKNLPAQTTDIRGNTSWSWTLQSLGLTEGTWKITANAINGTHQTSSADATNLQVHQ